MPGLYYDETEIGQRIEHRLRRTVTEADNVMFCAMTHNPQPLHLDAEYARETEFGQRVVNSLFTMSLAVGVSVEDTTNGTIIANLGFGETRFMNPVFHGDTLRFETEIIERRDSQSRENAGIITMRHEGFNQHNQMVCSITRTTMLQKRPS